MAYRPEPEESLARFAEAWTTTDPDARWSLVHAATARDVVVLEPDQAKPVEGQAALAAYLGVVQAGGLTPFEVGAAPDGHHGWLRVPWRRGDATGVLVVRLDGENRLEHVVRFLD